jgi:oxygen-independent coproporphyrinogen-3 oxidase
VADFGVYIHFPYCVQRCPYCDFAIAVRRTIRHDRYRDAVERELAHKVPWFAARRAVSVYFGGGTPSLWRPDCIAAVLRSALAQFPPPPGVEPEITVECDPAELSPLRAGPSAVERLTALRHAGVNRLSLGAQSFSPRQLQALGRRHGPEDIYAAVVAARQAGFRNLSVDLMIGLLDQSVQELDADLRALLSTRPEHVSLYLLTVEPRTPLSAAIRRGAAPEIDPDAQAAAYRQVCDRLAEAGFAHYEISNFARRDGDHDLRARHNRLYWTGGEYLGLGVGAHSFRRLPPAPGDHPAGSGQRFANLRGIDPYLAVWAPPAAAGAESAAPAKQPRPPASLPLLREPPADPVPPMPAEAALPFPGLALFEDRDGDDLAREAMWLSLRRVEGVLPAEFRAEYGLDPCAAFAEPIAEQRLRGLLAPDLPLRLTPDGLLLADEVGAAFL